MYCDCSFVHYYGFMANRDKLLARAKNAMRESKTVDFKREFDVASPAAWCEIIKDIVAFANSGGGIIILGVEDNGTSVDVDLSSVLAHDTADITNKILRYTSSQFSDFELVEIERAGKLRVAIVVEEADVPIVFTKPGTYDVGGGKQKTAFSQGTVYFRHGSKSEPGNREDFISWRDRAIAKARKTWLGGIKKVVQAPPGEAVGTVFGGNTENGCCRGTRKDSVRLIRSFCDAG
jgi:Putative DNA-binding domain